MNDLLKRICDAYVQGLISEKHFLVLIKQVTGKDWSQPNG